MAGEGKLIEFPKGFIWGSITSSYQIEGAWNEGGKGVSIWDTFTHTPGKIERDETADVAVDHYHRWQEDLDLMANLGLKTYCFSLSWPRIIPNGDGEINQAGLDFYDRLVDGLLTRGIQPYAMLYHWDLPQALQDQGGWAERKIVDHFSSYTSVVARRLGDRVANWITHDEPFVASMAGYFTGIHAPGVQNPFDALRAAHHMLLSHGCAVQMLRAILPAAAKIGIILSHYPACPATDTPADQSAAVRFDGATNRLFLDPLFRGEYPSDMIKLFGPLFPEIQPGDLETISTPIDFLGLNYYTRFIIEADPDFPVIEAKPLLIPDGDYSQMWEIYPPGIYDMLARVHADYQVKEILITENGVPVTDGLDFDGRVRDERRVRFLRDHLSEVHRSIQEGIPVRGYFHWTFMDNFEWAYGYRMRFGLVYVDFNTQKRIVKDSGYWYSQLIRENGFHIT